LDETNTDLDGKFFHCCECNENNLFIRWFSKVVQKIQLNFDWNPIEGKTESFGILCTTINQESMSINSLINVSNIRVKLFTLFNKIEFLSTQYMFFISYISLYFSIHFTLFDYIFLIFLWMWWTDPSQDFGTFTEFVSIHRHVFYSIAVNCPKH